VVDEDRLARELEVRVRVMPAVPPAAPRERFLLRDTEHHHPGPVLPLGRPEMLQRNLLLSLLADHLTLQVRSVDRLFFQGYVLCAAVAD
jgi:hypothetical protein